jgi:hypothetical protein
MRFIMKLAEHQAKPGYIRKNHDRLPLVTVISTVNGRTTYEEYDANPGTWVINIANRMRVKCWGGGGSGNG